MTDNTVIPGQKQVAIILHNGGYDRASYALCIAQAALASGMQVHMLLTYEGLRRFTKGHLDNIIEGTSLAVIDDVRYGLDSGSIQPLEEQLAETKNLGLKLYACPNVMASLKIPFKDLIGVDDVMGLVSFLAIANDSDSNWYI